MKFDLPTLLSGGVLKGQRTYLMGAGMVAQAVIQWAVGDLSAADLLARLPEILGGLGLMSLRAGVAKITEPLEAAARALNGGAKPTEPGQ